MTQSTLQGVLLVSLTVLASVALARQCRKPTWWPGQLFAHLMNASHYWPNLKADLEEVGVS